MCGSIHMVPDRPLCRTGLKFRFWPGRADSRPSSSGRNRCTAEVGPARRDGPLWVVVQTLRLAHTGAAPNPAALPTDHPVPGARWRAARLAGAGRRRFAC